MKHTSKILFPFLLLASQGQAAVESLKLSTGEVLSVEADLDETTSFLLWDDQRSTLIVNRLGQLEDNPTVGIYYAPENVNVDCASNQAEDAVCGKLTLRPFHIGGRKMLAGKNLQEGVIRFQNFSSPNFDISCPELAEDGSIGFAEDSLKEIACSVVYKKNPKKSWVSGLQRKELQNELKATGLLEATLESKTSVHAIEQKPDRIDTWNFTFTGFMTPKGPATFAQEFAEIKERMHLRGDSSLVSVHFLPLLMSDSFRNFLFDPCLGRVQESNFARFCELASNKSYLNYKKLNEQKKQMRREIMKDYLQMILTGEDDSAELSTSFDNDLDAVIRVDAGTNAEPQGRTVKGQTTRTLNFKVLKQFS